MEFDILITTRNRASLLAVSVPLMLSQSRTPHRLLVVDSSDNHDEVVGVLENMASQFNISLKIIKSKPGIAYQRNIGLEYVESPVVMMPDDDSLWFPGYTEAVMRVYERDGDSLIGSVCGLESLMPPAAFRTGKRPYRKTWLDRLAPRLGTLFAGFGKLFPDPIKTQLVLGLGNGPFPAWLTEEEAEVSVDFSGFKASFRSEVVKKLKYDELLGTYSLFEDRELLLRMLDQYIPACAGRAKVYHYRYPEKRSSEIEWGVINILNKAYIVCKHSVRGSLSRSRLKRHCYYKLFLYLMRATDRGGRERVIGAWRGLSCLPKLLNVSSAELPGLYVKLRAECLHRR
jgi:glycosyltransferase involved in cell wall biosynthesis